MNTSKVIIVLVLGLLRLVVSGQTGIGYSTYTSVIRKADLVGDNEIDTGNFILLEYRNVYDIPGIIDEEHERAVFIKVKSLDDLVLNKRYVLPDSQIYAKTYYWSPCSRSETSQINGEITRLEKNDTAEVVRLNLRFANKKGGTDTLVWNTYAFTEDSSYFAEHKVDYQGKYDNLRIALKEPLKVKQLDLSYEGVWRYQKNRSGKQELPSEIGQFKNLIELNLALQNLKSLPPEFSGLDSLRILDLSYNNFETFPVELFSCTNLDSLDLKYCRLSAIPADIARLTTLKKLILNDNWLNGFPLAVTNLPQLTGLAITNGNVAVIPRGIGQLTKLEKLDLSNFWNYGGKNRCDSLANLAQLTNLKELNLGWTKINALPVEFSQLKKLEVLNIEFNDFPSFPEIIDQLPNLKLLIIGHEDFDKKTMKELKRQKKRYKVQIDDY